MMDFTVENHKSLIAALQSQHYTFTRFDNRVSSVDDCTAEKNVILRHDVDLLPHNALAMAQLEADMGIRGTYYFRIVPESFDQQIIEDIAKLGHEIGYHYEDVDLVRGDRLKVIGGRQRTEVRGQRSKVGTPTPAPRIPNPELIDLAMESFLKNLETMRKIADIKTICMHGSPMSKYDNRLLWTKYDYRNYGIIGEPYFDVDFSEVAYYTDTGRRWDGDAVSVRDKVVLGERLQVKGDRSQVIDDRLQVRGDRSQVRGDRVKVSSNISTPNTCFPKFRTTHEMIRAIEEDRFPQMAMLTVHPQRWHDRTMPWVKELVWQNVKNLGKRVLVRLR